jgi:predicted PurR-regulated permease PerM
MPSGTSNGVNENKETINISTTTLLKVVLIVLLLWFLWIVRDILILFLISIIISSAIDPVADYLSKRRIPRGLSVLLIYVVVLGLVALVGFLMVPPLVQQFDTIKNTDVAQGFTNKIGVYRESLIQSPIGQSIINSFRQNFSNFGNTLFATTRGVVTGIVSFVTVLVVSFYLTIEENGMKNFIKHLIPYKHQGYAVRLVNKIQRKMGAWVLGQFILSVVIFGLVFIGLSILKVKFALLIALVAGIFEVVPFIGPFISGAVAIFFAFLQSPGLALAVLILWVVTQQLEAHVVVPVVMSRSVGINPVLVILGVLAGGTVGGIVGALVAIPVMSGISVFVTDVLEGQTGEEG